MTSKKLELLAAGFLTAAFLFCPEQREIKKQKLNSIYSETIYTKRDKFNFVPPIYIHGKNSKKMKDLLYRPERDKVKIIPLEYQ